VSFTELDQGTEMIIFEAILKTLAASFFFEEAGAEAKLSLSTNRTTNANLAKSVKHSVSI
jgi:hypothetical protein